MNIAAAGWVPYAAAAAAAAAAAEFWLFEEFGEVLSPPIAPLAIDADSAAKAAAVPNPKAVMPWRGGGPNGSDNAVRDDSEADICGDAVFVDFSGDGERSIDVVNFNEEVEWFDMEEMEDDEPSPRWRNSLCDRSVVARLDFCGQVVSTWPPVITSKQIKMEKQKKTKKLEKMTKSGW